MNAFNIIRSRNDEASLHFQMVGNLGVGAFGTVVLAHLVDHPQPPFAIKRVPKDRVVTKRDRRQLIQEREVLSFVSGHPFVIRLECAFESNHSLNFVMEYCPGGNLYELLQSQPDHCLSLDHVEFYAASIAWTLKCLHATGVIHRDVKPDNVLLDAEGFIRLADFGLARNNLPVGTRKDDRICRTFCGTVDYYAPEILKRKGYGYAVDLWSLGCVVYELLTGRPPFHSGDANRVAVFNRILREHPQFPADWSPDTLDFVQRLLSKNPSTRLGCGDDGMEELMHHRFFRKVVWRDLENRLMTPPFVPGASNTSGTSSLEGNTSSAPFSLPSDSTEVVSEPRGRTDRDGEESFEGFEDFDWCSPDWCPPQEIHGTEVQSTSSTSSTSSRGWSSTEAEDAQEVSASTSPAEVPMHFVAGIVSWCSRALDRLQSVCICGCSGVQDC